MKKQEWERKKEASKKKKAKATTKEADQSKGKKTSASNFIPKLQEDNKDSVLETVEKRVKVSAQGVGWLWQYGR